jgi:hypothetical protein
LKYIQKYLTLFDVKIRKEREKKTTKKMSEKIYIHKHTHRHSKRYFFPTYIQNIHTIAKKRDKKGTSELISIYFLTFYGFEIISNFLLLLVCRLDR